MKTLLCLHKAIGVVERICIHVAAAVLFAIMLIVAADVALRYIFHAPLSWSYDLISLYLMAAVFLLSLSHTHEQGKHINVDLFSRRFGKRSAFAVVALGSFATAFLFGLVVKQGAERTWQAWVHDDVLGGAIAWPTWAAKILLPIGFGVILLRLFLRILAASIGVFAPSAALADLAGLEAHAIDPTETP